MRQYVEALHQLARIAVEGPAAKETLALAASTIRRATGAAQAIVVYAEDQDLLVCSDPGNGAGADFTQIGLWIVQRQIIELGGPVAFNLIGHRVEEFTSAFSDDDREFLALAVPTSESPSEMCMLRGPWKDEARAGILRFMESAMPALTIILERFLNADRSRRQGEQLHVLANAAQVLTRSEDVEAALTDLATAIAASTGFEYIVNIDLYDATTARFFLRILSEHRHTSGTLAQIWRASLNPDRPDPWKLEAMNTLQPISIPDVQNDRRVPEHVRMFFTRSLLRSLVVFPMLFQDEFLGTMSFVSFKPHTFPPEEASFLQGFVTQAATALKALQMHNELQRYADEIRRSAEEYIATTNLTGDIIVRLDKDGRCIFLNDAACEFFARPREEMLGVVLGDYLHPEDAASAAQAIREMREDKELVRGVVNRWITPMGTRVVEWNGYPFFDEQGKYSGFQATGRDITERKQMEDALLAKTEEYIATTNLTGDIIARADEEGRWTFLNDAACQFLGKPREELLGTDARASLHPEDLEPTVRAVEEAAATKELIRGFVNRQITPMGTRVVEWNACPLFDADGQYVGIQMTGRDITERKKADEALRESEERLRTLVTNAPVILWAIDRQGVFTLSEGKGLAALGLKPGHVVGRSAFDIYRDYPQIVEYMQRALAGEELTATVEAEGLAFETHYTPVRDHDGEIVGSIGVAIDISERKHMEEALEERERRYRLLAENASDVIWTMDMNLRYTYISPSITRMRGYSVEEVMAQTVNESMTSASRDLAVKTLAEELAIEKMEHKDLFRSRTLELEMYCKDGSTMWCEMKMTFLRDPDGQPVGILGVTRDISERKKAELERQGLHAELEVRAITDSLTGLYDHAQFYRRLAEEIERSKRYNHGFAVVMMDVDNFKRFNDSRGHQAGDKALRLVGYCIRSGLRRSDLAFRYGGDEFTAILPHADSSKTRAVINRINGRITKSLEQMDGGAAARLSLSAGIACFPNDGRAADDLVRIADAALYSAKWVARARDIMGQREDIQSLVSALVSRRAGVEAPAGGAIFRPEALHEQHARIVSSVASSIAVALKDAGVSQALEDPDLQILAVVGAAAEIKDQYIRGHPERTSEQAAALAEEMGLSPERVRDIRIAGLLHDVGKITVSEGVLNKPGKVTRREFAMIKDHPIVGATLVSQVRGFERLLPIIRHHHERFDGKGYPDGLAGEEIPLEARILSVVDVFDALTHERSYRKALSREETLAELERGAGTQFDPAVVEAFVALVKRRGDELAAPAQAASEDRQVAGARAPRGSKQ